MRQIEKIVDVPTVEQAGLREAIGILPVDPGVLRAIRKDLHLVEAALQTDRIIVSLDDKMREHLATAALRIADLKRIMWVNPTESRDNLRRWLNDGAKWKPTRALGRVRKS